MTPRFRVPGRLGAGMVIATGLLLVLAATVGPLPAPAGDPGAKVMIRLPDVVRVLVLGLLALSAVILVSLQRRRPTDDTPGPSRPPRRLPPWAAALVSLLPLVLVVLAWYLVSRYWAGGDGQPIEKAFAAIAGLLDLLALADKPPTSIPSLDMAIAVLLVLLTVGIFALMVLVALADRLEAWWAARGDTRPRARPSRDPRRDPGRPAGRARRAPRDHPRVRPLRARARGRPGPAGGVADAGRVHADHARPTSRWPAAPVRRLTALFEVARFSAHPLGIEARDAACDCLDQIGTALEGGRGACALTGSSRRSSSAAPFLGGVVLLAAVPVYVYVEAPWRTAGGAAGGGARARASRSCSSAARSRRGSRARGPRRSSRSSRGPGIRPRSRSASRS